jgi:hypothetical protein
VMPGTRFVISSIALGLLLPASAGAGAENTFRAGAASDYAHQSGEKITIGAKAYNTEELTTEAFGKKTDLLKYGVLPVLVVIENKRPKALDLRDLEVNLVASDGRHASAVAPEDIPSLGRHAKRPGVGPRPPISFSKKNPLNNSIIVERAFAAKMLPPGDSASGFFYFEASSEAGDKLYLNGLREAGSGEQILYFEFPLSAAQRR